MYSLSGMAWRSVALHGVSVRVYQYFREVPAVFVHGCVLSPCGASPGRLRAVLAVSGSFAYYACACTCPCGRAWLSVRCHGARVLSSISSPSTPLQGSWGLSSIFFFLFPLNSLFSVAGA